MRSHSAGDLKFGEVAPALPRLSKDCWRRASFDSRSSKEAKQTGGASSSKFLLDGEDDLGELVAPKLGFLEVQRKSNTWASQLKDLLKGYQKPSLIAASKKTKFTQAQPAQLLFGTSDDLEQLLKAEELQQRQSGILDPRRLMTIDDTAAAEINHERRGTEAVRLTSDLNPAFADAMVRFGILRNEVFDKAKDKKEKADRLLSHMSNQVQYGIKRRLRRSRTPQKLVVKEEDPEQDSQPSLDEEQLLSQRQREERRQRKQLKKSVAKFDKWVADYLEREGLKPKAPAAPTLPRSRPSTAPAGREGRRSQRPKWAGS